MTKPENITNIYHQSISDILRKTVDNIDERYQNCRYHHSISTGFSVLDRLTNGFQSSELVVVAGRPSMGTSAFAINVVEHVAIESKNDVAVFNMEMPSEEVVLRMISSRGTININKLRTGHLDEDDWPRLTSAVSIINEANLFIEDSSELTITDIHDRVQNLNFKHKIGLIVIDNFQLIKLQKETENRGSDASEISRGLKELAKKFNVPVIVLSAINSDIEDRPNKRPVISDLYETGSLEKDADLIVFIYRDELYNEFTPDKDIAEIIIGKHRYGPTGVVKMKFIEKYSKFQDKTCSFDDN